MAPSVYHLYHLGPRSNVPSFTCYRLHETLYGRVLDDLDEYIEIERTALSLLTLTTSAASRSVYWTPTAVRCIAGPCGAVLRASFNSMALHMS